MRMDTQHGRQECTCFMLVSHHLFLLFGRQATRKSQTILFSRFQQLSFYRPLRAFTAAFVLASGRVARHVPPSKHKIIPKIPHKIT